MRAGVPRFHKSEMGELGGPRIQHSEHGERKSNDHIDFVEQRLIPEHKEEAEPAEEPPLPEHGLVVFFLLKYLIIKLKN